MMTLTFSHFGMLRVAPLIPLLPLLAAALIGLLGTRVLRSVSHWLAIIGVGGALVCSAIVFGVVRHMTPERFDATYYLYSWFSPRPGFSFDVNFRIDPLAAIMLVTVCVVSLLVTIYSRDYMREHGQPERGYERYFAFIALFVFSMCTLVLAGNFLLLYVGWELVGLCSYLLIGFHYQRPSAAAAAKKAFIVNRIGDFGFGLGVLAIYYWISPFVRPGQSALDYAVVFENVRHLSQDQCTTIALLLFAGAVGKSAQIPLYVWLPDAMEGPSPVSALIHAATMVTAGVYMVVRCGAIFVASPLAMSVVTAIGAVTALYAATIALAQHDMKRILAYSTISQLGYMFLGVGVLAADSAIFHLYTHAFFKALLFLAAGSVMHAMGGIIDVRQFSGLRRILPWTCWTFVIGALALAGFPFFSGFFSKDEIIHAAFQRHIIFGIMAMGTALLTAFYTFRMVFLAFWGEQRIPKGVHPHESGPWMLVPLVLLAIGAIGAGYVGVTPHAGGFAGVIAPHGVFHKFLAPAVAPFHETITPPVHEGLEPAALHGEENYTLMYVSAAISILGIALAWWMYARRRDIPRRVAEDWPELHSLIHNKYYVDEWNEATVVRPLWRTGLAAFTTDNVAVDGMLSAITMIPRSLGALFRTLQDGVIQSYGVTMTASLLLIVLIVLLAG
jgi:NADH-quinone oxidoreductase subunit L